MFYKEELEKIGFSAQQAEVYSILVGQKELKGSEIIKESSFSKQTIYSTLEELESLGLIVKNNNGSSVTLFKTSHPSKLKEFVYKKEEEIKKASKSLSLAIDEMISSYNLVLEKPGIEFYEGIDGVVKILDDTLKSKTDILTFADLEMVDEYAKELNENYKSKRKKNDVQKKMLLVNSELAQKRLLENKTSTEIKILEDSYHRMASVCHIYDNKVAFITFKNGVLTSTLTTNPEIYNLQKELFLNLWDKS